MRVEAIGRARCCVCACAQSPTPARAVPGIIYAKHKNLLVAVYSRLIVECESCLNYFILQ